MLLIIFTIIFVLGKCLGDSHPWISQSKDDSWVKKHEGLVNQTIKYGEKVEIVFIGDSITEGWRYNGSAVWNKYYAPRLAFNYGIGGDRTENLLWRIEHKEFDGLKPKVAVLMIGTNNLGYDTIEDIAHGIHENLQQLKTKMPSTKILLLGLLPKAEPQSTKAKQLNILLKEFADEKTVYWLDMWSAFETKDGKKRVELYVDGTHLNPSGYEVWHKTMEPMLTKLEDIHPWEPQPKYDPWVKKHEKLVNQTIKYGKRVEIVFIGDSITENWNFNGSDVWNKYYFTRLAFNYGISGDKTENLLWRIEHKEFDGLQPKVAVLMIGTNNLHDNTNEDIVQGVHTILQKLSAKMPSTKILLLALLPKAEPQSTKAKQLNPLLKNLTDDKTVYWLDMWSAFVTKDGKKRTELYVDGTHLNPSGYEVWHKTMEPTLFKLLGGHPWVPQSKDEHWVEKHERLVNQTLENGNEAQIVFIGDSITEGWRYNGSAVWDKYYAPQHAFNYGIGGDRTENLLWRIADKELDGLKPKVAVLMIGTNNLGPYSYEDITRGVQEVIKQLSMKMSSTKIILLAILPRAGNAGPMAKQLNVLLKKLSDEKTVFWLDMWTDFSTSDGEPKPELYQTDHAHPNQAGYEVWHKVMGPLLNKLYPAH